MGKEFKERDLPERPGYLQTTYVPSEHAQNQLRTYGLAIHLNAQRKLEEELPEGGLTYYLGDIWYKKNDGAVERVTSNQHLSELRDAIKRDIPQLTKKEKILGIDFKDGITIFITKTPDTSIFRVWVPKTGVEVSEVKRVLVDAKGFSSSRRLRRVPETVHNFEMNIYGDVHIPKGVSL